ncbi:hypothetical protein [Gloeobacter morelensis]|uniref:Choice-of-anchor G family protein n=1 Tax=Gloeobacter morelensis MG652769 TaxID=2781736 RepID=A0ABY3PRM8_9CYAN|nr:hypothetical protein [Gloeobacter morelensis]UFP96265.1 hypothetical protein ISF26_08685 [Gloeobacter morelensis MG652769]
MRILQNLRIQRLAGALTVAAALGLATPALAAPTEALIGGTTSVQLSSDFLGALTSLGVQAGTLRDATLSEQGVASFAVIGGAIDLGTIKAEIIHRGGLSLSAGGTVVELSDFSISTLGTQPVLTGLVTVNDELVGRVRLFNLGLTSAPAVSEQIVTHQRCPREFDRRCRRGAQRGFRDL